MIRTGAPGSIDPGRGGDEARALELRHPPVGIGAEFGRESLHGLERALDRGAVRDGLRGKEAHSRQLDVAGAESPAPAPLDGLARFGEEGAGSGAIAGGPLRVRERRQDARLVPQCGAPRAREPERRSRACSWRSRRRRRRARRRRETRRPRPGRTDCRALPPARQHGGRERARRRDRPAAAAPRTGIRASRTGLRVRRPSRRRGALPGLPELRPRSPGRRSPAPTRCDRRPGRWSARAPPAARQAGRAQPGLARRWRARDRGGRPPAARAPARRASRTRAPRRRIPRRAPRLAPHTRGTAPRRPRARTGVRRT